MDTGDDRTLVAIVLMDDGRLVWPPSADIVKPPQILGRLHDYARIQDATARRLAEWLQLHMKGES
jgi:hypothetical protein